jgi:hypothetical protein
MDQKQPNGGQAFSIVRIPIFGAILFAGNSGCPRYQFDLVDQGLF